MPRGKKKGRDNKKNEAAYNSDSDDESINDNNSEWSTQSEPHSNHEDAEDGTDAAIKDSDRFEDTLAEAIDGLGQKSAASRVRHLTAISGALRNRWSPSSISSHRLSVTDHIEKSLKRGKGDEQGAAAELASLIAIQFGASDLCEELYKELKPTLLVNALDKSVHADVRAKCITSLGLICFLAEDDMGAIFEMMQAFETVFSGSYLKGDGSIKSNIADLENLHSSALSSWSLLLSLCSPGDIYMMLGGSTSSFSPSLSQLGGMLKSPGLEVRLSAGEALALVFELGREHSETFGDDIISSLIDDIQMLATDSHKYRAKKDRKTQRATFRDILRFLEDDDVDDIVVKVHGELLRIEGWCARRRYTALGTVLGAGLQTHLGVSPALRVALGLPAPQLINDSRSLPVRNNNKLLRHLQNAAAFKARTISRGKNRDKRTALISS